MKGSTTPFEHIDISAAERATSDGATDLPETAAGASKDTAKFGPGRAREFI